ncbi:MAG: hypothetical protein IKO41_20010 [Lachnospiraceae bacterium]|nr:hypothetical protein [Lachnospiraceae bacterium]MBR6152389.1 hypothetical protein [Lachnospiraceae bacterium]
MEKGLIQIIRYALGRTIENTYNSLHKFSYSEEPMFDISCRLPDLSFHIRSSTVIEVSHDGNPLFFRKCAIHGKLKDYVFSMIDFYYSYIQKDHHEDKEQIVESLNGGGMRKFVRMGFHKRSSSTAHRFLAGSACASDLGIATKQDDDFTSRIRDFVKYSSNELTIFYNERYYCKRGKKQTYHALNSLAYDEICRMLGLSDIICANTPGYLRIEGVCHFGMFMAKAKGIQGSKIPFENREIMISPAFQRKLLMLNAVDYLCNVYDHGPYNYYVSLDENQRIVDIESFDNDEIGAFPVFASVHLPGNNISPFICNKKVNRPYFDKQLAERILSLNQNDIYALCKKYLNHARAKGVAHRFDILKESILNSSNLDQGFLLDDVAWNGDTIREELSGKYGKTYLVFYRDFNL